MQPVEPDAGTEEIRRRAYQIWQEKGQPEGRDQDHWNQAVREIRGTPDEQAAEAPASEADLLAEDTAAAVVEADYAMRMLAGHPGDAGTDETSTGS
jgi:hypothetical protein